MTNPLGAAVPAPTATPAVPGIEVRELTKLYGNLAAVSGLSFAVERGEVLGLVGPNGAGKTTTLRSLSGIIRPSSGTIHIAG
ncbi:MAG: ATP-binding cassette domain-containing protein, partial [Gemmatimonadaceae bacterium]